MTERSDLSTMVVMKEQQIQELAREKGELLRRLMTGNQLRLNLGEGASSCSAAESEIKHSSEDEERTMFYLTEKVGELVIF